MWDGGPLENQHLLKGYPPKKCEMKMNENEMSRTKEEGVNKL